MNSNKPLQKSLEQLGMLRYGVKYSNTIYGDVTIVFLSHRKAIIKCHHNGFMLEMHPLQLQGTLLGRFS